MINKQLRIKAGKDRKMQEKSHIKDNGIVISEESFFQGEKTAFLRC